MVVAQPGQGGLQSVAVGAAGPEAIKPRVSGLLNPLVNLKLEQAYPLALGRLQNAPACRALFNELGANGVEMLKTTIYYAATYKLEHSACSSSSVALTMVGSPQTRLCQTFSRLSAKWAAMLLIHEALYFAGLEESPPTPGAMNSAEINKRIIQRCDLR